MVEKMLADLIAQDADRILLVDLGETLEQAVLDAYLLAEVVFAVVAGNRSAH